MGKATHHGPTSNNIYELLPRCGECGAPKVRIRQCECGHESVYHDPPGVGRCKVGAGLRDCGCARFTEDTGDVA